MIISLHPISFLYLISHSWAQKEAYDYLVNLACIKPYKLEPMPF